MGSQTRNCWVGANGPVSCAEDLGEEGTKGVMRRKPSLDIRGLCLYSVTSMVCPKADRQTRSQHTEHNPVDMHMCPGVPLVTGSGLFYHNFVGTN